MALSFVSYTGNGSTTSFAVPFLYLSQADVFVTVGGSAAAFTWTNPALIHFTTAPANGASILIKRSTNIVTLDVVFTDGSTVQASDVNTDVLQALYLAQEQADNISTVIAQGAAAQAAATAATAAAAAAQAAAVPMVGDSGSGGTAGLVPAPPAGSFAAKKFLSAGGTWVAPGAGIPNPPLYLENFGGGTGVSDNTAAFNAALAALSSGSGCIVFGPGVYNFASAISFTYTGTSQALSLVGYGADVTSLVWGNTDGLALAMSNCHQSFHLRDLSFRTSATNAHIGFSASQSVPGTNFGQSDIERCNFTGTTLGDTAPSWATAINIVCVPNVKIDTVVVFGGTNGLHYTGNAAVAGTFKWAIVLNVTNCQFIGVPTGILLGTWWQGVFISNCDFTNGSNGIFQITGDTSNGLSQLMVKDCQFGVTGYGIILQSPVFDVNVMGCLFLIAATFGGVFEQLSSGGQIVGNSFTASGTPNASQSGVIIGPIATVGSPGPTTITGNTFYNLTTGVFLQTSSSGCNVQSNAYKGCTSNTSNSGTGNTIGGGSA